MINIKGYIFYPNKNVFSSLISIFGIGRYKAMYICKNLKINFFKKNKFLSADEIKNISDKLSFFKIGDTLKRYIKNNIIKLIDIKCYKGIRHRKKLPVRGQNTKNNARTRRGPKKVIFFKGVKNVKISKKGNKKK